MSLSLELHCVRHSIAIKIFRTAFAASRLPETEQPPQAVNIALLKEFPGFQLWKRLIFCIKVVLREIKNLSAH